MAILETDYVCWKLDDNGNLVFPIVWLSGIDAIVQGVRCRLRLWLGEWFLKLEDGVDWQDIFGSKPMNQSLLESEVQKQILATPGVDGVVQLSVTLDNAARSATVTAVASTAFGDTPVMTLTVP